MRRKDREMGKDFALQVIDKCEWGTMSVIDIDGNPYAMPLSVVREGNNVYFHSARSGLKIDCLKNNNRVCLSCVGDTHRPEHIFTTEYESATIIGRAVEVIEMEEKSMALKLLCEKYTPKNMNNFASEMARSEKVTAVWRIEIEKITGKRKKYANDGRELKFGEME